MVLCIVTSSKLKPALFLCLTGLLSSCAQSPQAPAPLTPEKPTEQPVTDRQLDARSMYQLAANYSAVQQQEYLLQIADQALQEQDYLLALAITETLKHSTERAIVAQTYLPLLKAYLATAQHASLTQLLQNTAIGQVAAPDQAEFLWLSATAHSKQQSYLNASRNLLRLAALAPTYNDAGYTDLLWQNLTALGDTELQNLRDNAITDGNTHAQAWIDLTFISRRYIGQPDELQQAFANWQQRYPHVFALAPLPAAVQQLLTLSPYQPQRIAVLLPLSGQFKPHAQAIQYGILAAASNSADKTLVFIDSQQDSLAIEQQVLQAQADFVIGPLLKDQVDRISQLENWPWPTLFLNSKDSTAQSKAEQFYFALSMEDEAAQMAQLFSQKSYRHPVVISAASNISLRMQQRFAERWQQLGHESVELHQFNSKEELETLISSLLETDKSRDRVKQISNLMPQTLESDPHSRLDIDAIYLIADPVQTRLFKPFVDVSISQTAPKLPVYASSRSHSTNLDSTDQRDLNGLTFTEMPWMMDAPASRKLREQYQQLFPEQDETLQRLFAMGFDAYQMIGSLKQQQQMPGTIYPGLTGRLRLDASGNIVRELSWAGYRKNRFSPVTEP